MTKIQCLESDTVLRGILSAKMDLFKCRRVMFISNAYSLNLPPLKVSDHALSSKKASILLEKAMSYHADASAVLSRLVSSGGSKKNVFSSDDKAEIKELDKMISATQAEISKLKVQISAR